MEEPQIKALVSLISDSDREVVDHVEQQIMSLGDAAIPFLELEWENSLQPDVQKRIEDMIHQLQYDQLFKRLEAWRDTGGEDLLEGLWLIATYQYPDLEYAKLKRQLEELYYEVWLELRNDMHPVDQVQAINHVLFTKHRFSPNTRNFHAPGNSMINVVLESKKGNPISLCSIYLLICQKLRIPVYGVNLPNLFILTYKEGNTQFYINAFNRGVIFRKDDIDNYLQTLTLKPHPVFYEPCNHLDIIRRALRNLMAAFDRTGDTDKIEELQRLLEAMGPGEDESLQL